MLLKVKPCPKPRMTRSDSWKKRPAVTRYWEFADELRKQLAAQSKITPVKPTGSIILSFGIPFPKSKTKKFRVENLNKDHKDKPDLDNLIKAVLDVIYQNDAHISEIHARKLWSEEGYISINWV